MKITVTDDQGRSASYELPDAVGREFTQEQGRYRSTYEEWLTPASFAQDRIGGAVRLAVLDVFEEKPVQVGHLAKLPSGTEMLVLYIARHYTFVAYSDGSERVWENDLLTYSRPKPEGWGQQ